MNQIILRNFKRKKILNWMQLLIYCIWIFSGNLFVNSQIPGSYLRILILKLFGAKIGQGVVFKTNIKIKLPWNLKIGDYTWIGEEVWIDNLSEVRIGNNCCISQGVYFCTGSHNFKSINFDLILKPIFIEDHCWIGAKSIIAPGANIKKGSFLKLGTLFIR